MARDLHETFLSAQSVAVTWIGAAIGPLFFRIGLDPEYRVHLIIGIVSLLLVAASIFDGIKASRANSISGFIVFTVVPVVLLVLGGALAMVPEE